VKPDFAIEIIQKLRDRQYEAYLVGGCVRDMVMGLEPADYDIATSARPEQIMSMFSRTEAIGAQFGVVLVIHHGIRSKSPRFVRMKPTSTAAVPPALSSPMQRQTCCARISRSTACCMTPSRNLSSTTCRPEGYRARIRARHRRPRQEI
jgi:hypothetical protein